MNRYLSALLVGAWAGLTVQPLLAQRISFETGSWQNALARAKQENKLIFIDVYTTWCGPCKMLDMQVFTNKTVAETFNTYFINYKANAEQGEGTGLAQRYGVRAYPTALFVDGDGQLVDSWVGFKPVDVFKQEGERVFRKTPIGITLSLYDADYKAGNRSSAFMRQYLRLRRRIGLSPTALLDQYVGELPADSLRTPAVANVLLENAVACQGPAFDKLLSRKEEPRYRTALEIILQNELNRAGMQHDRALLEATCRAVERLYPTEQVPERAAHYKLTYAAIAEDWRDYTQQAVDFAGRFLMPQLTANAKQQQPARFKDCYDELNNIGHFVSQHGKDDARLSAILTHLVAAGQHCETPVNTSLQARLRYRLGERDVATNLQAKALELAKTTGDDLTSYEETLRRMQKKKSL